MEAVYASESSDSKVVSETTVDPHSIDWTKMEATSHGGDK